jgi:hypothetical protein
MKLRQTQGASLLNPQQRRRLEGIAFPTMEQAKQEVQHVFPNHLVRAEPGRISVVLRDKSFQVAVFQEVHDSLRRLIRP